MYIYIVRKTPRFGIYEYIYICTCIYGVGKLQDSELYSSIWERQSIYVCAYAYVHKCMLLRNSKIEEITELKPGSWRRYLRTYVFTLRTCHCFQLWNATCPHIQYAGALYLLDARPLFFQLREAHVHHSECHWTQGHADSNVPQESRGSLCFCWDYIDKYSMCVYVCVYVYIYICIYIYTHMHT